MRRIIFFELKKLFRNRLLLVMLALLSVLNVYHIYSDYAENVGTEKSYYDAYFNVYEDVSGAWDTEKIKFVVSEYEKAKAIVDAKKFSTEPDQPGTYTGYIFGDYGLFEKIKTEMEKLYHYDEAMADLTQKAADNAAFYQQKGNAYLAKVNQKIEKAYQNRNVSAFYDTFGLTEYFKYDFSTLLILILLIPMLSPLFAKEHEIEMYGLLKITPNFRKMSVCKMLAGAIAICFVSIIFLLEDLLTFTYLYHINGFSQPIYTLSAFFHSPLTVSISSYILLNAALKLLGFLVLGGVCMFVSSLVKNEIIPFCTSFAVTLILVVTDAFIEHDVVSIFNPVTLFSNGKLFREFQVTSIFEVPVYTFSLPIAAAVLELILLYTLTIFTSYSAKRRLRRCKHEI